MAVPFPVHANGYKWLGKYPRSISLTEPSKILRHKMSVSIRSATANDSTAIAEIYFQAYQHLGWFQHVNGDADANDLKAFFQSIVLATQKVNGVTLVAEKNGQLVGHLLGWERASDSAVETALPNPYYDTNVTVGIRGRVCSRWVNQQADIRHFCGQMGSGRFFCEWRVEFCL